MPQRRSSSHLLICFFNSVLAEARFEAIVPTSER